MNKIVLAKHRDEGINDFRKKLVSRTCILSGKKLPSEFLIRFVVDVDGNIVPDLSERLPGRGLWLTGQYDMILKATSDGVFQRVARRPVSTLGERKGIALANLIDTELAKRCLFALGMARRAGKIVVGFDQVRSALKKMSANTGLDKPTYVKSAILITAKDAALDGRNKLKALSDRLGESGANIKKFVLFDSKAMGKAIGREQFMHGLVETDVARDQLYKAAKRLAVFRGDYDIACFKGSETASLNLVSME
jgi:predicted RNA-binding protein YlxR (DUF448 family)